MNKRDYVEGELFCLLHSFVWDIGLNTTKEVKITDKQIGQFIRKHAENVEDLLKTPKWVSKC